MSGAGAATGRLACFKAYDVRGRVPAELNADLARRIGQALPQCFAARTVVVGHDIRLSSPALADALAAGLCRAGARVLDIGQCGTEEVYFATWHAGADAGVMVTASHNPADYNGFKFVARGARPVTAETGLDRLQQLVVAAEPAPADQAGQRVALDLQADYVARLLRFVTPSRLRPLRLVVNAGNGGAGRVIDRLAPQLPCEFVRLHHEPDGRFPHGVPNPLLPENRAATAAAVRDSRADFGVAWDGDFDRCFFFDEHGEFVEGYYIVGLLARSLLAHQPGETIVHDPRLTWFTREVVAEAGGRAVQCRTGHAFMKACMRAEHALYGGEMSGHHYFRDFAFCDSGMIPWLLVAELVAVTGEPLSALVASARQRYPASGEINLTVADAAASLAAVAAHYAPQAPRADYTDGLSLEFANWRCNLRASNTEPLLRLNVESRGDPALLRSRTEEILRLLKA